MANSFNEIFGKNLKRIMYDRNITQAQMSKELNIPKTTISSWMNGKRARATKKYQIPIDNQCTLIYN